MPPRPKPVFGKKPAQQATSSSSTIAASTLTPGVVTSSRDDDDAQFIKNKNRTAQDWKALAKRSKESERKASHNSSGASDSDSNDSDGVSNASPRSKKVRGSSQVKHLASWTKQGSHPPSKRPRVVTSDDEDDLELLGTPTRGDPDRTPQDKRRRVPDRDRSPSLTPPPEVPRQQLEQAVNIVRGLIGPALPVRNDVIAVDSDSDSDEGANLNSELRSIVNQVKRNKHGPTSNGMPVYNRSGSSSPVSITVRWMPHPKDQSGQAKNWTHKQKQNEILSALFEAIADEMSILSERLIITYDNRRIFPTSTPGVLEIWSTAEFEACTDVTYQYLRETRFERAVSQDRDEDAPISFPSTSNFTNLQGITNAHSAPATRPSPSPAPDDAGETVKITLRGGPQMKEITATVRKTTKCGKIVSTFLQRAGLSNTNASKAKLSFDGEHLLNDDAIGEAVPEIENDDMLEVVGF